MTRKKRVSLAVVIALAAFAAYKLITSLLAYTGDAARKKQKMARTTVCA